MANCAEIGRDLSSIRLSVFGRGVLHGRPECLSGDDAADRHLAAQDPSGAYADAVDFVVGPTPAGAIRQLRPLIDLGVTLVVLYFWDRRSMDIFAREVIPAFAR